MGNKGLKSYTKQLSFELGEMKAFVNPNISDSNLIITLPLVTTRGSDPLSMSLIYNFLDDINGDIISGVKNSFYSKRKVSYVIEMPDGTKEEIDLTKGFDFGRGIEGEGIEYRNILEDIYPQEIRHHKQNIPIKYKDNMEYDYGVTHIDSTDNRIHKIYRNGDLIEINGQGEYRAYVGTKVVSQCKEVIGEGILSIEYYGDFGNIIDEYSISRRRIISDGVEKYIITMKSNEENMYYEFYLDTNKKVTSIIQLNKKDSSFSKKANIEYDNNVSHIYSEAIIGNDGKTIENRHDAYICFDENNNVSYEYNNKGIYTYYLYSKDGKLLECAGPIDTNDLGFFKDIKGRYYMENSSKNLMFKKEFHDGNRGDYSVLLKLKFNRRADVNVMFYNENVCESKMISYNGDRPVSKLVVLELKDNSARNYLECLIKMFGTNDVEVEFIRVYEGSLLTQYKYDDNKLMSVINGRGFEVYKYDNLERITKTFSSNGSSSVITYEGNTSIIKERMANSLKEYNSDYYKNIKDLPQSSILEYEDLNGIHKLNNKCSYQSYSGIISDYIDEFGSKVSYLYDDKYNLSSIVHNDEVNKISNDRKGRISSYRILKNDTLIFFFIFAPSFYIFLQIQPTLYHKLLKNSSSLHDVSIVYDDLNSSYAYINNDEQEYRFKYDDFGNVTEVYYHNIKIVSREYCKYTNRLLKESVNNKEYKYKYDGDGKLVEVVDERNRVVCKYQYDAFNRVTKTSDNNYQSAYTYDDNDAMLVNDELYEREYRALNNNLVIKLNEQIKTLIPNVDGYEFYKEEDKNLGIKIYDKNTNSGVDKDIITYTSEKEENEDYYLLFRNDSTHIGSLNNSQSDNALRIVNNLLKL